MHGDTFVINVFNHVAVLREKKSIAIFKGTKFAIVVLALEQKADAERKHSISDAMPCSARG